MTALDGEIAIVGYGPVGITLAILLAQQNHSVVVAERWPEPYPLPRAVHLDHEVARILQGCGIGDELRRITESANIYEWRNGEGTTLLRIGRVGESISGWPESLMFNQPTLETVLDRRARILGVDVRRGMEIVDVTQNDEVVSLQSASGETIRARYAIGCDGANSTVRALAGLAERDLGFFYDWLIVDVLLDEPRVFNPINLQLCDPARPTTVVSGGPGRRRWEFMRLPHEGFGDLNSEERAWNLLEPWNVRPDNARLERHAVYTFNARHAVHWRSGRVLLAGDAAHQMPPFAGQGLCAGIRDAANLAWKLHLSILLDGPDQLLDTYEQERMPSARLAIEFSMQLGAIICVPDPDEAARRDADMAALVEVDPVEAPALPGIEIGVISDSPHAGALFVQGRINGDLFDDRYGSGWCLVVIDDDIISGLTQHRQWFEAIGGQIVTVPSDDPVYGEWFASRCVVAALQRPDFHLFGTAATAADLDLLVSDLRDQLTFVEFKEPSSEAS